jgi:hypothetical protein
MWEMNAVTLAFGAVQTVLVVASAVFAWVSIRKFRDSRGIDFILNAEGAIDPLRQSLVNASPEAIRNIYASYNLDELSDEDCRAFPFMQSTYAHASRIFYILNNRRLDLGLKRNEREELLHLWMVNLSAFDGHPAMMCMHRNAQERRDFHENFLRMTTNYLGRRLPVAGAGGVGPDNGDRRARRVGAGDDVGGAAAAPG